MSKYVWGQFDVTVGPNAHQCGVDPYDQASVRQNQSRDELVAGARSNAPQISFNPFCRGGIYPFQFMASLVLVLDLMLLNLVLIPLVLPVYIDKSLAIN